MSQSIACSVVYAAKKQAEKQKFPNILRLVYKKEQIFKVANQKKTPANQDFVEENCNHCIISFH